MSNYLPNYQKKVRIRKKREDQLRRLISQGAEKQKLLKAAELLTDARARALRAQASEALSLDKERIQAQIRAVTATTAEDVLAEFPQPR
jgi:hypothetical protein